MANSERKPSKLYGLFRLFIGTLVAWMGWSLLLENGYEGVAVSFFFALMLALGARWMLVGLAAVMGTSFRRAVSYGLAFVAALAAAVAGPMMSNPFNKSKEAKIWGQVGSSTDYDLWRKEYTAQVPQAFRRPEYRSRMAEALCAYASQNGKYGQLRQEALYAFDTDRAAYDDQARQTISETYRKLFTEGLKKIPPSKNADPKLQAAFQKMLQSLSTDPTRRVLLRYEARGKLGPHPSDKQFLADIASDPRSKLPIEAPGDAYTEKAERHRQSNVLNAFQKAFEAAFPKDLFQLQPDDGKARKDDIILTITSDLHRKTGFYTNSIDNKPVSLLYKFDVDWNFAIVDGGEPLGRFHVRSEPAKSVRFRVGEDDPAWAPYSIMLDSAADNFGRLVVANLGFKPLPERTQYTFEPLK